MGEFTNGESPSTFAANNEVPQTTQEKPQGYKTDVENVFSDDIVKVGIDEFPCFDVEQDEFFQNSRDGRKKLRFKGNVQQYMQNTRYNRPFFIRTKDNTGKVQIRKIK